MCGGAATIINFFDNNRVLLYFSIDDVFKTLSQYYADKKFLKTVILYVVKNMIDTILLHKYDFKNKEKQKDYVPV